MSRKARYPIQLPKGVEVKVQGNTVQVKGPKGTLSQDIRKEIQVSVEGEKVVVSLKEEQKEMGKFLGLFYSLIKNMVEGTSEGFKKELQMIGVGYRAAVKGKALDLLVGLSHPTEIPIPEGIEVKVEKNTSITISGIDKQQVGQFAAGIRSIRPPEPYQGKGIRYKDEYVRRKAGKAAAGAKK